MLHIRIRELENDQRTKEDDVSAMRVLSNKLEEEKVVLEQRVQELEKELLGNTQHNSELMVRPLRTVHGLTGGTAHYICMQARVSTLENAAHSADDPVIEMQVDEGNDEDKVCVGRSTENRWLIRWRLPRTTSPS